MDIAEKLKNRKSDVARLDVNIPAVEAAKNHVESPAAITSEKVAQESIKSKELTPLEGFQNLVGELDTQDKERKSKEEKANRLSAIFAGIGDGVSSLANLYYATKGAPSVKQVSSIDKFNDEYIRAKEKREAERERLNDRMLQYAMQDANYDKADKRAEKRAIIDWDRRDKREAEERAIADSRYRDERAYRADRDKRGDELRDKQIAQQDEHFKAQQQLQQHRIAAAVGKSAQRREQSANSELVSAGGRTYNVTPKFLEGYIGNMVDDALADVRKNYFKNKTETEINASYIDRKRYDEIKKRYSKSNKSLLTTLLSDIDNSARMQATLQRAEKEFKSGISEEDEDDFENFLRKDEDDFEKYVRK
ncbi:MAG: hypothetical protein RR313_01760 [Anaerovoracaceae bacterium]